MPLSKYLSSSIGLTQAVAVLVASLLIGLGLGGLQLAYTLAGERRDALALIEEILTLAEGGATNGAWTLDSRLANQVIHSIMATGDVQAGRLTDEDGAVLAEAERQAPAQSGLVAWFAKTFIGEELTGQRELFVGAPDARVKVGTLSLDLAPAHFAKRFGAFATSALLASLIQAMLVGVVLLWLSSRLVTAPLRRVATSITDIDPDDPTAMSLRIPRRHAHDELGELVVRTNQMLRRLADAQEELRTLATCDALTGLPNRALIVERLDRAILHAKRNDTLVAVLFLDLDRFKHVNDSLGHDVGDSLLVTMAGILTKTLRINDSVGRLGGDEFLVVLEGLHDTEEVVRTVRRILGALENRVALEGHDISTTCSLGIATFPRDGRDSTTLMRHADLAMYEAKANGGGQWHFFADEMEHQAKSRLEMETALGRALDRDELRLVFQPKVHASSGALAGCEALLRWSRNGKMMLADDFVQFAEDTGIIVDLGYWVLQQACQQIRDWTRHFGPTCVAINVSARQLREARFVPQVLAEIERYGIDARLLELEMTETVLVDDLDRNFALLETLRDKGVTLSIDDFGTGYSSLSYLTRLPVDALKIDRCFVSGAKRSKAILDMVIAMARALGLKTVAEGVETTDQRDWLIAEGCDVLQGNLISEPVDARRFEERCLAHSADGFDLSRREWAHRRRLVDHER